MLSAAEISRRQSSSSAIHSALNPSRGIRDDISRRGGTPKNHARDNARRLRLLAAQVRERKDADDLAALRKAARPPTRDRYAHVPSRLYRGRPGSAATADDDAAALAQLLASGMDLSAGSHGSSSSSARPVAPPSSDRASLAARRSLGHHQPSSSSSSMLPALSPSARSPGGSASVTAASNGNVPARRGTTLATAPTRNRAGSADSMATDVLASRKTRTGQLPSYLVNRKEEWARDAEEKKQRQIEKDTWPPGTVPVPEQERLETLAYLQQSLKELTLELSKFAITLQPSNVRTYARQQEVLSKMREVEKGIEVYSQTRVFMAKVGP
ncbi:hypothetical protein BC828DRAFT_379912 [Blastocladiella britannica]|nr:hypothetical protein BC828DRAFT_379912 [Blastocladiella britannica]